MKRSLSRPGNSRRKRRQVQITSRKSQKEEAPKTSFSQTWQASIDVLTPDKDPFGVSYGRPQLKRLRRNIEKLLSIRCEIQRAVYLKLKQIFEQEGVTQALDMVPGASIATTSLIHEGILEECHRVLYLLPDEDVETHDDKAKVQKSSEMQYGDKIGRQIIEKLDLEDQITSRGKVLNKDYHPFQFPPFQHAIISEHGLSIPRNLQVGRSRVKAQGQKLIQHRDKDVFKSMHINSLGLDLEDILRDLDDVARLKAGLNPRIVHLFDTPYKPAKLDVITRHIRETLDAYPYWEIVSSELVGYKNMTHYTVLRQLACADEDMDWFDPKDESVRPYLEVIEEEMLKEEFNDGRLGI
ncbi:hypothetical protein ACFL21_03610 [Patescibacteria group bacterium]